MVTWQIIFLSVVLVVLSSIGWYAFQLHNDSTIRCSAAQDTVLEEADLIKEAGNFPSEKITDRWKKLLEGCE